MFIGQKNVRVSIAALAQARHQLVARQRRTRRSTTIAYIQ